MANVLVRNVADDAVAILKEQAARNRRSLQEELRILIEKAAADNDYWERRRRAHDTAQRIHAELAATGQTFGDSTEIIREDRDSDHGRDPNNRR